jgi:hypothetical protein
MPVTANKLPGTGEENSGAGSESWADPGDITIGNDATYAHTTVVWRSPPDESYYLVGRNFGFSVPNGRTISDIKLTIRRGTNASGQHIKDKVVRLWNSGAIGNDKKKSDEWDINTFVSIEYDHDQTDWGTSLSPADVNGANFGACMRCIASAFPGGTAIVAWYKIQITYSAVGGQKFRAFIVGCLALGLMIPRTIPILWALAWTICRVWGSARQIRFAREVTYG